jgi:putative hydrolase of HD superfamily
MMRLAEKVGYAEEARFRMARIVAGEYYDGMGYGVLRAEWEDRYPDGFAAHLERGATSRAGKVDEAR